jgi:cytochrome d ubiquinol oxidase subunit I
MFIYIAGDRMSDLFAARSQMAMSLGFHIIFAAVGIAMPLMMMVAEWLWLRTGQEVYLTLAKQWAKGTAILFAVGAVSGTVLSFELGLLWPGFMRYAGSIIGMPFSLEGFAFFLEAIFLGIYLYGWKRVSPWAHWFAGAVVAFSGMISGVFVVTANAWMNTPAGFQIIDGKPANIDPVAAMLNPAAAQQVIHMTIAAYAAVGFAVAAIHAYLLLRNPHNPFHRRAFAIAFSLGGFMAVLQPLSGDFLARQVFHHQPVKLAAMEGQFKTETRAPLHVGGWPDEKNGIMKYDVEIPDGLTLLVYHRTEGKILGLEAFPRDEWPPVAVVHLAFDIMVGCGMFMMLTGLLGAGLALRKAKPWDRRWFLQLTMLSGPLGFIAIETGWTVTEVGRQPWIIFGIMRTADAVTPMPKLIVPFVSFTVLYLFLAFVVIFLLKRQVFQSPETFGEREKAAA